MLSLAAAIVLSTSLDVWAADRNQASNCDGGGEIPVELCRQAFEGPDAGGHRKRIPRQRSRLIDGTGRRDQRHEIRAPAVGADGKAAADDLAEAGEVRLHAGRLLRAAG